MRSIRELGGITLRGIAMGAADVVPGVSGGTIAFITGIYEELIRSIRSVNLDAIKLLFQGKFRAFWEHVNGFFLIALVLGIGISILSLSKLILFILENHPVLVWSFFFGLVLASAVVIMKDIKKWTAGAVIAFIAGTAIAYAVTVISPAETTNSGWFIFLCGATAICAMILPGISGSFILLLMGKYEYIFNALHDRDFGVIGLFIAGAVTGLLTFSHVLAWAFKNFRTATIALLSGFMIGSLNKVWPWKQAVETRMVKGELKTVTEQNLLPGSYEDITGNPAFLGGAIALFIGGFLLIWFLEKFASKKQDLVA